VSAVLGEWRYFRLREIRAARLWAASGGVAVHDNEGMFPFTHRSRGPLGGKRIRTYDRTAHLLAMDAEHLIAAAAELGLRQEWLQRHSTLHFDLFGSPLNRAVARCVDAPLAWPAIPPDFDDRAEQVPLLDGLP